MFASSPFFYREGEEEEDKKKREREDEQSNQFPPHQAITNPNLALLGFMFLLCNTFRDATIVTTRVQDILTILALVSLTTQKLVTHGTLQDLIELGSCKLVSITRVEFLNSLSSKDLILIRRKDWVEGIRG